MFSLIFPLPIDSNTNDMNRENVFFTDRSDTPNKVEVINQTDEEFPRVPVCKWASVSIWHITTKPLSSEEVKEWRQMLELIEDADELSGDISRPGDGENLLREVVRRYPQVCKFKQKSVLCYVFKTTRTRAMQSCESSFFCNQAVTRR